MKKVLIASLFLVSSLATLASEGVQEVKDIKKNITNEVHLSGTMISSCGVTWSYSYDCYSDCSMTGTINNLAAIKNAINNACGTDTECIDLEFDQG